MGKALVIKGVDFSTNKLTQVDFTEVKPCTSIELNHSTYSLTSIGATVTLTASVLPVDTTDEIEWASSDNTVATVANGVVTAVKVGSATITATCGEQTATCAITITQELSYSYVLSEKNTKAYGDTKDYGEVNPTSAPYAALYSATTADRRIRKASTSTVPETNIYPILIPSGATEIRATLPDTMKITMWFLDTGSPAEYNGGQYYAFAKVISGDASEYGAGITAGNRTVTIPEGVDSVIFTLYKTASGAVISDSDVESVTIKAG